MKREEEKSEPALIEAQRYIENPDFSLEGIGRLDGHVWALIMSARPDYAKYCPFERFDAGDWITLLTNRPELLKKINYRGIGLQNHKMNPGEQNDCKEALSSIAEAMFYLEKDEYGEYVHDYEKFWDIVSRLDGRSLALLISECPKEFYESDIERHNVDLGKLDVSDWKMLLARCPKMSDSLSFECEDSIWEFGARISKEELAPDIRWYYSVHAGEAYLEQIRGKVITEYDKHWAHDYDWSFRDMPPFDTETAHVYDAEWYWKTEAIEKLREVTVPSHIDGYLVVLVDTAVVSGIRKVSKLIVPEGVIEIAGCCILRPDEHVDVVLPSSLRCIGSEAFSCWGNLKELVIPEGCEIIGYMAFEFCRRLERIAFPSTMKSIEWRAFVGCSGLEDLTIPNSVKHIGYKAFSGCSGLRNVVMPKRFKRRQNEIFADCSETLKVTYI